MGKYILTPLESSRIKLLVTEFRKIHLNNRILWFQTYTDPLFWLKKYQTYHSVSDNLLDSIKPIPIAEHQQCEEFCCYVFHVALKVLCKPRVVFCLQQKR